MNLQKKLASKMLRCSDKKIWIDPTNDKVRQAITRRDIRRFIKEGIISRLPDKKAKKFVKKRQQRTGSIKGTRKTRIGAKNEWLKVVRPQRRMLKELKDKKQLKTHSYRKVYRMIKGNAFRSRAHLNTYLKEKNILEEGKK
jgi:large subunit ribosomal protein L19e